MLHLRRPLLIVIIGCLMLCCSTVAWAQCNKPGDISHLFKIADEGPSKVPLILIHGIHGTENDKDVKALNNHWKNFRDLYQQPGSELKDKYALYIFQYCSDREEASLIAGKLRDAIDADTHLRDRKHVILAHSMGGLVAKYYMTLPHLTGAWNGSSGGDTMLGLITLATPHHGTPGANSTAALNNFFSSSREKPDQFVLLQEIEDLLGKIDAAVKKKVYGGLNFAYWTRSSGFFSPPRITSAAPSRSDLRWDNYDKGICENRLGLSTAGNDGCQDINLSLLNVNKEFEKYASKVILYSGTLDIKFHDLKKTKAKELLAFLIKRAEKKYQIDINANFLEDTPLDNHELLEFANWGLFALLNQGFGVTDGLVPSKSALLCDPPPFLISSTTPNFICGSKFRARRFEAGTDDALPNERPDANTLSIKRIPRGYDHEDMYEHPDVLRYVVSDLKGFVKNSNTEPPPTVPLSKIPTLFLFDVSGSMSDNGKIGQAREAGLDALQEMRENAETTSPVSIMTFSGDNCGGRVTQKLLNFSLNLTDAESTMRTRIPVPNGGTPLPQAKDAAYNDMLGYLNGNTGYREGRIIVLSDGQSTCGAIRPPDVYSIRRTDLLVTRTVSSRIRYLTIGFDVPAGSEAERDLQYLASISGGKYYNAADRKQLTRAFQKQVRRFVPRPCNPTNADFAAGLQAFADLDYPAALVAFRRYTAANPNDWCGSYNLALAYEANDRYKKAADNYRLYLRNAPNSPDRLKIEQRINQLRQDYLDQLDYYANLMQSDVDYLKRYYQSAFDRSSTDLAQEFSGFVYEKRGFYADLPDILEIDARWIINDSKDISSSIDVLAKRKGLVTFDRDAVSLLTIPLSQIEDMINRLRNFRTSSAQ